MQPAKPLAASKNAALASVTSTPRRSSSAGSSVPPRGGRGTRPAVPPPRRVQTAQCPSSPPTIRRSTGRPSTSNRNGVTRSEHDVVVVAGVQGDVVPARLGDGADHVERLVAVERRDLDRDDVRDLREPPPERVRQQPRPPPPAAGRSRRAATPATARGSGRSAASSSAPFIAARLSSPAWYPSSRASCRLAHRLPRRPARRPRSARAARHPRRQRPPGPSPPLAIASTGRNSPTFGSRIANCVVCTPTARPPAPGGDVVARTAPADAARPASGSHRVRADGPGSPRRAEGWIAPLVPYGQPRRAGCAGRSSNWDTALAQRGRHSGLRQRAGTAGPTLRAAIRTSRPASQSASASPDSRRRRMTQSAVQRRTCSDADPRVAE